VIEGCLSAQEVVAAQMRVTIRGAGVDARRVDGERDRGLLGLCSSNWMVPLKSVKWPRTLVTRWRTWNVTSEWVLSIVYVLIDTSIVNR